MLQLYGILQGADVAPTSQVEAAVKALLAQPARSLQQP
jgi:hypothetical protein